MSAIKLRPWEKTLPVWRCWEPDQQTEDDAEGVEAADGEQAAADYAEWLDSQGGYEIVGGHTVICVRGPHPGAIVRRYKVSCESVPTYTARPA